MNDQGALLIIDKTSGWTSHDVINVLRAKINVKKVGHAGTLDPNATGLLLLLLGSGATRKQAEFLHLDKVYQATIKLGVETDTWDAVGQVVNTAEVPNITLTQVKNVLKEMTGKIEHQIPFYSAKKCGGKPMYTHAREGANIERVSLTTIYEYRNITLVKDEISFEVFCSSGTYIRSLAVMLAKKLGTLGHIKTLRRLQVGKFKVDGALTPEQIKTCSVEEILQCQKPL